MRNQKQIASRSLATSRQNSFFTSIFGGFRYMLVSGFHIQFLRCRFLRHSRLYVDSREIQANGRLIRAQFGLFS